MSKHAITVLIVALCILAVMGGLLAAYTQLAHEDFEENITVSKEGRTTSTVEVNNLVLYPATSRTYTVHLRCKASGTYHISLSYEEKNNGGLKPFVNVTVKAGGQTQWSGTLEDLLAGNATPTFSGELQEKDSFDVQIIYEMPGEVGNEAQDTFADFDVHFTIEKE